MRRPMAVVLIAGLLLGLLVIAPTATPFRVESAAGDAMAPTIGAGDAYVTVPADTVLEGDIVVFWAPGEGEFLTREVFRIEERGYVVGASATPGDPRVIPRSAIVGTVATVGGSPIVLPGVGGVVSVISTYQIILLFVGLLVLTGLFVRRRLLRWSNERTVMIRLRTVAVPLLVVMFITCLAITPLSTTSYQLTYTFDGGGEPGPAEENTTREAFLPTATPPLTQWVVSGEGATVLNWTAKENGINATLSVPPPETASRTEVTVRMHPYPRWVPAPVLEGAHGVHPIFASLAGAVALVAPLAFLYWLVLDPDQLIMRIRRRRLYLFRRG